LDVPVVASSLPHFSVTIFDFFFVSWASSRHSPFNWADPAALDAHPAFAAARATEVQCVRALLLTQPQKRFGSLTRQHCLLYDLQPLTVVNPRTYFLPVFSILLCAPKVVLAMGEVLYIPSYWFHYIVSQDASIQCNARSGKGDDITRTDPSSSQWRL